MRNYSFLRSCIFFIFIISLANISIADIDINSIGDSYYIGEAVKIDGLVSYDKDRYGFIEHSIKCGKYTTIFYKAPINLIANEDIVINNINLILTKDIVHSEDDCHIISKLFNQDDNMLDDYRSKSFDIERNFNLTATIDKDNYYSGDTVEFNISLEVPKDIFNDATIDITINKKLTRYETNNRYETIEYVLPLNIESGTQVAIIQIEDNYGNKDYEELEFKILGTPTKISNLHLDDIYSANQDNIVEFKTILYDQGNSEIDDKTVIVKIYDPKNKIVASDTIISTRKFGYEINNKSIPGIYKIISTHKDITKETTFRVINSNYVATDDTNIKDKNNNFEELESITTTENRNNTTSVESKTSKWIIMWRIITIIPALYFIYRLIKRFTKSGIKFNFFKTDDLKSDKFYGLHKKKKVIRKMPRKVKARIEDYEED